MLKSMQRTEHTIARALVATGLGAGLWYLTWRALFSLAGTDLWLSIPLLLVEVAGFVGSALLAWALWPHAVSAPGPVDVAAVDVAPVDVLVRVGGQGELELRATLLALRSVACVREVVVVERDELANAVARARTSRVLLLDAGDVPTTDIVTRLSRGFVDERVAVVQGLGVSFAEDSIEHGPHGRHDLTFERSALNPALGARGCAIWTGSGSLVSVDALREVLRRPLSGDSALEKYWALSAALLAAGWRVVAPADVAVVAHRVELVESAVDADRRSRVRAAQKLVGSCRRSFPRYFLWRQRLALLAWCVRPLSGFRRAAFMAVLVLALYVGAVPFTMPLWILLAAWLPSFVATSVGLCLLSGWRLRPGDRARWSLVSLTPVRNSTGLVVGITALTLVLLLRGISDEFTHTLGLLPRETLLGLIVVTLWTLAMSLDGLRLLARRTRRRGGARVASLLPAILGERSAKIVDLTASGAGLLSQTAAQVGERVLLVSSIVTASGTTELRVWCDVHSVVPIDANRWRIGVEFGALDGALADALSEYCTVEPMWERLGVMPETSITEARRLTYVHISDAEPTFIGKGMLRFLALIAIGGAIVSSVSRSFEATRASAGWMVWVVVALAIVIGASLLVGLIGSAQALRSGSAPEKSSSLSPDLAIK